MKEGIYKNEFVEALGEVLAMTRLPITRLSLEDNDTVIIHHEGGHEKEVNIAYNSGIAIIKDVVKNINY